MLGERSAVASCRRGEEDVGDAAVVLMIVRPPVPRRRPVGSAAAVCLKERLEEALGALSDAAPAPCGIGRSHQRACQPVHEQPVGRHSAERLRRWAVEWLDVPALPLLVPGTQLAVTQARFNRAPCKLVAAPTTRRALIEGTGGTADNASLDSNPVDLRGGECGQEQYWQADGGRAVGTHRVDARLD